MIQLPRPRLLGGAIEMIAAQPSPEHGRKVALDMRILNRDARDFDGSRV